MHFSRFFKTALILGLLSAIGPFAIDMYLPALPEIGASLGAEVGAVQWSLTAFFVALGVDPETASKDACKVEHDLSEETYSKMIAFAEKAEKEELK